jgi:hypothetical protein
MRLALFVILGALPLFAAQATDLFTAKTNLHVFKQSIVAFEGDFHVLPKNDRCAAQIQERFDEIQKQLSEHFDDTAHLTYEIVELDQGAMKRELQKFFPTTTMEVPNPLYSEERAKILKDYRVRKTQWMKTSCVEIVMRQIRLR